MNKFVCADCGNEQNNMLSCKKCCSFRVILISVAEDLFGPEWRKAFTVGIPEESLPQGTRIVK